MKEKDFNIEDYLSGLNNENGLPLSDIEKDRIRESIEANGLCGFSANGEIIQVVQPLSIH